MLDNKKVTNLDEYRKKKQKEFDAIAVSKKKLEENKIVSEIIEKSKNLDW